MNTKHIFGCLLSRRCATQHYRGFAAQKSKSNSSSKQLEDQMRSMQRELKKTKAMINNNSSSLASGNAVGSDETSKKTLKAIQDMSRQLSLLKKSNRSQLLLTAIRSAELNSFVYYPVNRYGYFYGTGESSDSADLVREILFAFH